MAGLTPEQLLEAVRSACARVLEVDGAQVHREQRLSADLGADSLAVVGIVELVEQHLAAHAPGAAVPDEDLDALRTVGDVVDAAARALARR